MSRQKDELRAQGVRAAFIAIMHRRPIIEPVRNVIKSNVMMRAIFYPLQAAQGFHFFFTDLHCDDNGHNLSLLKCVRFLVLLKTDKLVGNYFLYFIACSLLL